MFSPKVQRIFDLVKEIERDLLCAIQNLPYKLTFPPTNKLAEVEGFVLACQGPNIKSRSDEEVGGVSLILSHINAIRNLALNYESEADLLPENFASCDNARRIARYGCYGGVAGAASGASSIPFLGPVLGGVAAGAGALFCSCLPIAYNRAGWHKDVTVLRKSISDFFVRAELMNTIAREKLEGPRTPPSRSMSPPRDFLEPQNSGGATENTLSQPLLGDVLPGK